MGLPSRGVVKMSRRSVVVLAIALTLSVAGMLWVLAAIGRNAQENAPVADPPSDLTTLFISHDAARDQARCDGAAADEATPSIPVSGPVLVVDPTQKAISEDVEAALPEPLRTTSATAARLLVWADWCTQQVGTYQNGASANQYVVHLTFVQMQGSAITTAPTRTGTPTPSPAGSASLAPRETVLGEADVWGSEPPSATRGGDQTGDIPSDQAVANAIVDWLNAAPR